MDADKLAGGDNWEVTLGRVLLATHNGDKATALAALNAARVSVTLQAGPAGLESYPRSHPLMVKLHMLWDLEQLAVAAPPSADALRAGIARIEASVVDVESRSHMLALISAIAELHRVPHVAAEAALRTAAACRAARHHDAAWPAVLRAERGGAAGAFVLKAKLLWDSARRTEAAAALSLGLAALPEGGGKLHARARLRTLTWQAEAGQGATASLQAGFQEIVEARPRDDKAHMQLALFLGKAYEELRTRCAPSPLRRHCLVRYACHRLPARWPPCNTRKKKAARRGLCARRRFCGARQVAASMQAVYCCGPHHGGDRGSAEPDGGGGRQ